MLPFADNPNWIYYSIYVIYALTVLSIVVVVLSENRHPVKSLAWVCVLILLPVLGPALYLVFGRSIKNTRMISRRNRRKLRRREEQTRKVKISKLDLSAQSRRLLQLTRTMSGAAYYYGHDVDIYTDGGSMFKSLLADLEKAEKYINLEFYIFRDDEVGRKISDILIKKAREGVKVRLIYDHVGSFEVKSRFFRQMRRAGVQAYPFFRVIFPFLGTRINWRNHRKIAIIDGKVGYIGGMNIADRYIDGGKTFKSWRDTHVRVTGSIVNGLVYSFAVDWNFMGQPLIEDDVAEVPATDSPRHVMQVLTSGPTSTWSNLAMLFIRAVSSAQNRVYVQTPYFLPTEALLKALQSAALSGCDVRVMIPKKSDSRMLTEASASYISECLQSGIKIYFYTAGMLHAKTILVDDEFVSIGSTNFDFRSFEHNFEANLQIYSREVNDRMASIFMHDLKHCERVNIAQWRKRPLLRKAVQSLTRLLSPIL